MFCIFYISSCEGCCRYDYHSSVIEWNLKPLLDICMIHTSPLARRLPCPLVHEHVTNLFLAKKRGPGKGVLGQNLLKFDACSMQKGQTNVAISHT